MNILSKCWDKDHWVEYKLVVGEYQNLLDFLINHSLFHLAETTLDFNNIPNRLRGKRYSRNLSEYIEYNDDPRLIYDFCNYFFVYIINTKYISGASVLHEFVYDNSWKKQTLKIKNPYSIITTTTYSPTTTTTTYSPTTTTTTYSPTTTTTINLTTTTTISIETLFIYIPNI